MAGQLTHVKSGPLGCSAGFGSKLINPNFCMLLIVSENPKESKILLNQAPKTIFKDMDNVNDFRNVTFVTQSASQHCVSIVQSVSFYVRQTVSVGETLQGKPWQKVHVVSRVHDFSPTLDCDSLERRRFLWKIFYE